jgi:P-type Mg2+ transporter
MELPTGTPEATGLSSAEAAARLRETGPNEITSEAGLSRARVLWNQLRSPLQLLLLFAIATAAASLVLDFLPLLAGQILLNNLLSDIPAIGLAGDDVDPELVARPRRWNIAFVGRFMVAFGLLSSLFDFLTFAALIGFFAAGAELFRTAWFVESLITELAVALVVRTRRIAYRSRPGTVLLATTVVVGVAAFLIPYLPFAPLMDFVPLPASILGTLVLITGLYVVSAELMKRWFYRRSLPPR